MNNITDFIAGLFIQIGNYYKIKKSKVGWVISIICIIYWMARAYSNGLYSQCFWHTISISLAIYGYIKWSRE
jgi:hypothetical protein